MLDFAKFPFEKSVHLLTKFLPGFALLYAYNARSPGVITKILSLPYLGYATRLWLLIAICFTLGYTLSIFLNSFASAAAGAAGALWASFARNRHPYACQVAPWRDPNWRAAYIKRFGASAPNDTTLVLPSNAAELFRLSQLLPPNAAEQQKLSEQITLQINSELKAAVDAITNDTTWRMCYESLKFKVLFESPSEPIDEVFGRLDSDFSLASAVLIVGSLFCAPLRVWWLVLPAGAWLAISILRFCVRTHQIAEPWNTLPKQMELLRSEDKQ